MARGDPASHSETLGDEIGLPPDLKSRPRDVFSNAKNCRKFPPSRRRYLFSQANLNGIFVLSRVCDRETFGYVFVMFKAM